MYVCTDICTLRVDVKIFESARKHLRIKKYTGNGGGLGLSTYAQSTEPLGWIWNEQGALGTIISVFTKSISTAIHLPFGGWLYIREISRCLCAELRAKDATKCIKRCDARAKLLFCLHIKIDLFLLFSFFTQVELVPAAALLYALQTLNVDFVWQSFTFVKFKVHRCASACLTLVVKEMVTLNAKRSRAVLIFDWLTKKRQYVIRTIFILRPRQKLAIRRKENLKETTRLCRVS